MTTITRTRIRTLLAATAIAALGWGIAAPASAALGDNGIHLNGINVNGSQLNGPHQLGTGQDESARQDGFDFGTTAVLGLE